MTVQYRDILGEDLFDYDLVWFGGEGFLTIACVKAVKTPFKRINPAYRHTGWYGTATNPSLATPVSRHISGVEDKLLFVYDLLLYMTINTPVVNIKTYRQNTSYCTKKISEFHIINSPYAQSLIEAAKRIKK